MICIQSNSFNPFENIATEEYLLKNFTENIFFLYRNQPSVIVGKHQVVYAEINYPFIKQNQIPVIRRLSGGGAVYHDTGNVNFCFISNGENGKLVDFKKYLAPVQKVINAMGIETHINPRNNLFIQNRKISGNAEHIFKNRVLHHGTLLFNTNLDNLKNSLQINSVNYTHKAILSVPSEVVNISDYLDENINVENFADMLFNAICNEYNGIKFEFSEIDRAEIGKLAHNKYKTWQWNYGYSPKYSFNKQTENLKIKFEVENGLMKNVFIAVTDENNHEAISLLENCEHHEVKILEKLKTLIIDNKLKDKILDNIF